MKAGILTFYGADSYGAVLQSYALEQAVVNMGAECELVNINMRKKVAESKPAIPLGLRSSAVAASIYAKKIQEASEKRKVLFETFRKEHLIISNEYFPEENIAADYDVFIAGSDQIWNFDIPDTDVRYFLPFARPEQRFSYAASFGNNPPPEKAYKWCAAELSKFSAISVRETGGCDIVRNLTGKESVVCLDPVFLPEIDHWYNLSKQASKPEHVLLFMLKYDKELHQRAEGEANALGVPLKVVTAGFIPSLGMEAWNGTGVIAWLEAIRNAAAVYTNSFHGMAFSIIFKRPLRAALLGGELAGRNDRIIELLDKTGLSPCLKSASFEPDYDAAWNAIEPLRQESLAYLRAVLATVGE